MPLRAFAPFALAAALAAAAPSAAVASGAAGRPDLSGVWRLDLDATVMWKKAKRPLARTDTLRHAGEAITWSWHAIEPRKPGIGRLDLVTDGRPRAAEVSGHRLRTESWWEGDTLCVRTRGRALMVPFTLIDRITLADEGRVMKAHRAFRMATLDVDEHWVFQREASGGGAPVEVPLTFAEPDRGAEAMPRPGAP
jgi:hypothetical protein